MKKFFAILLVFAIVLSMAVPVFAAEEKVTITEPWVKYFSKEDIVTSTDSGATVYTFSGITAAYTSAGVDILPTLKTFIEGKDQITVSISVDAKVEYNAGFEGEDYAIAGLIRAVDINEKIKDPAMFKSIYSNQKAGGFSDTGGGNYSIRFFEDGILDDNWTTLEGEATFTANDIKAGLWGKLNLCFDRMNAFEAAKSISVKNTKIELTDYDEGDGEITIDFNAAGSTDNSKPSGSTVDTSKIDLTANADAEDIEPLPEGNMLLEGTKWTKGLGNATVTEGTFKEQAMYSMTGYNSAYSSAYLDLYPSLKAMLGDEDELDVYIVFDVRVLNYKGAEGESHPFGVKIRPGELTDLSKDEETFNAEYEGSTFKHTGSGGISVTLLGSGKKEFTEDWQRIELPFYITAEDLNDTFWTQLNLCFDNMANFENMGAVQIKNVAIFGMDDYEPIGDDGKESVNSGDTSVKKPVSSTDPVVLHKPIGFNKYEITFMESVETKIDNEGGFTDNGGTNANDGDTMGSTVIIIIASVAAVVVIGAVIAVIILKKKKNTVKEDKE